MVGEADRPAPTALGVAMEQLTFGPGGHGFPPAPPRSFLHWTNRRWAAAPSDLVARPGGSNSGTPEKKESAGSSRPKPAHLQALTAGSGTAGARRPEFLPGFQAQMGSPVSDPAFVGLKKMLICREFRVTDRIRTRDLRLERPRVFRSYPRVSTTNWPRRGETTRQVRQNEWWKRAPTRFSPGFPMHGEGGIRTRDTTIFSRVFYGLEPAPLSSIPRMFKPHRGSYGQCRGARGGIKSPTMPGDPGGFWPRHPCSWPRPPPRRGRFLRVVAYTAKTRCFGSSRGLPGRPGRLLPFGRWLDALEARHGRSP
jgi:hypothetical protein